MKLLEVNDLQIYFPVKNSKRMLKAVDRVSLELEEGETLGVVGESGSGKSTLALAIAGLYTPYGGTVRFMGEDIFLAKKGINKALRRQMQMVFQDPYSSFNPRLKISSMLKEVISIHGLVEKKDMQKRLEELMDMVGLPKDSIGRYPHEFSGGQRQRLSIARALAVNPSFILLDEPVSALDVSMQAQIINLLKSLQRDLNLTYMFISHDVAGVKHMSTRVAVMYFGRIMEILPYKDLEIKALHPYTQSLISAIPLIENDAKKERIILKGDVPSPVKIPQGCRFCERCQHATDICKTVEPILTVADRGHMVACHLYD